MKRHSPNTADPRSAESVELGQPGRLHPEMLGNPFLTQFLETQYIELMPKTIADRVTSNATIFCLVCSPIRRDGPRPLLLAFPLAGASWMDPTQDPSHYYATQDAGLFYGSLRNVACESCHDSARVDGAIINRASILSHVFVADCFGIRQTVLITLNAAQLNRPEWTATPSEWRAFEALA
jgi:hypothetical protein